MEIQKFLELLQKKCEVEIKWEDNFRKVIFHQKQRNFNHSTQSTLRLHRKRDLVFCYFLSKFLLNSKISCQNVSLTCGTLISGHLINLLIPTSIFKDFLKFRVFRIFGSHGLSAVHLGDAIAQHQLKKILKSRNSPKKSRQLESRLGFSIQTLSCTHISCYFN